MVSSAETHCIAQLSQQLECTSILPGINIVFRLLKEVCAVKFFTNAIQLRLGMTIGMMIFYIYQSCYVISHFFLFDRYVYFKFCICFVNRL